MKSGKGPNMAQRNTELKRSSSRRWAVILLMVIITGGGIYLWFFTGAFTVQKINMYEGTDLPVDSLLKSADEYVGCNIFMIPLGSLKEKILEYNDVADVVFRRKLFHSVDCYLKARKPVAAVLCRELHEVDERGVMLSGRVTNESVDLPLITGIQDVAAEKGKKELMMALEVLGFLKECGFSPARQLSEIHIENEEIVLVWMNAGSFIRLGKDNFQERIHKLKSVYSVLEKQKSFPKLVDLRFSRQVVIR